MFYGVSHNWDHPWSVEGHSKSDQASDSTQSPHHHVQSSHFKKASGVARPMECLIRQGSDRTHQSVNWMLREAVIPRGASC